MYPVVFFDALRVKIRDEATVRSKAIYLALAVLPDGTRDILGLWIEQTEGAKFWMKVFSDLQDARLPGHPDRGHRWPQGHERGAGGRLSRDDAADLHRPSDSAQSGLRELERAQADGDGAAARSTPRRAPRPPSAALDDVRARSLGHASFRRSSRPGAAPGRTSFRSSRFRRRSGALIYTTNALESVHAQLRKIIKTRGHFPTDDAATKLIWLALRNITAKWERTAHYLAAGDESIRDSL